MRQRNENSNKSEAAAKLKRNHNQRHWKAVLKQKQTKKGEKKVTET